MENENFKKASVINIAKFKIKWVARAVWYCINKPFDILMEWT